MDDNAAKYTLFVGWDTELETPENLGVYFVTTSQAGAPEANALGLHPDPSTTVVYRVSRLQARNPAYHGVVGEIATRIGITLEEIRATGMENTDLLLDAVRDGVLYPQFAAPEYLIRVARLREALEAEGYDSLIGAHAVGTHDIPFIAVWSDTQIELGERLVPISDH